jgi:hypothetical protein
MKLNNKIDNLQNAIINYEKQYNKKISYSYNKLLHVEDLLKILTKLLLAIKNHENQTELTKYINGVIDLINNTYKISNTFKKIDIAELEQVEDYVKEICKNFNIKCKEINKTVETNQNNPFIFGHNTKQITDKTVETNQINPFTFGYNTEQKKDKAVEPNQINPFTFGHNIKQKKDEDIKNRFSKYETNTSVENFEYKLSINISNIDINMKNHLNVISDSKKKLEKAILYIKLYNEYKINILNNLYNNISQIDKIDSNKLGFIRDSSKRIIHNLEYHKINILSESIRLIFKENKENKENKELLDNIQNLLDNAY